MATLARIRLLGEWELKVGVTGHQQREGIDWPWVRSRIDRFLAGKSMILGYSSLAAGTDQVFADAVLDAGGKLVAATHYRLHDRRRHNTSRNAGSQAQSLCLRAKMMRLRTCSVCRSRWLFSEILRLGAGCR